MVFSEVFCMLSFNGLNTVLQSYHLSGPQEHPQITTSFTSNQ